MIPGAAAPVYRPAPARGLPGCFIANAGACRRVLIAIHGISRNAAEIAARFAAHPAFADTAIVAPLFTRAEFGQYQQLAIRKQGQRRADAALIDLLDALHDSDGLATARVGLFGFSGGAQMAHRFAMLYPERVARMCLASAGWYCMPDPALAWPYGIGDGAGGVIAGPEFLDIPTCVMIGNRDTRVDATVRQDPLILAHQGRNRLRRARCYVRAVNAHAAALGKEGVCSLAILHNIAHDFTQGVTHGGLIDIAARNLISTIVDKTRLTWLIPEGLQMTVTSMIRTLSGAALCAGLMMSTAAQAEKSLPRLEYQWKGFDIRLNAGAAAQAAAFDDNDPLTESPDAKADLFARLNAQWTSPDGIIIGANVEQNSRRRASEVLEAGEIYGFVASD